MASTLNSFEHRSALAAGLADRVATQLTAGIETRGSATLAVSGGSTPKAFFEALSTRDIDWAKVTVTLVDERYVPADNPRSNHLLVAEHLLQNKAAEAAFIPLYRDDQDVERAAEGVTVDMASLGHPFDVVVLGMGGDGHTASFFPGGDHLGQALDLSLPPRVFAMQAEGAGEPRLTFSFSALHDARLLVLHIEGNEKKAVLETALAGTDEADMPIRAPLLRAASPVEIYWAP
ncbi:6-phosphogluconolactonase [Rhizobium halophytocola]|uniref:6-phosphogluconolactonase n=1 Tax=Rhizobium halophytocola TaxID=735519 RepID=A0ABS4E5I8_9HYPH|nr:6-phosphogluconolactonase [Rhizobium halophytocola]MBP1853176.1 6-phosphogluconolactonase [Rhizobium halophytocola]